MISKETEAMVAASTEVSFDRQFNGYDKEQVDRYVKNITKAYHAAYSEYFTMCAKYDAIREKYDALEARCGQKADADVCAKALLDAEELAKNIVADANESAEKLKSEAEQFKKDSNIEKRAAHIQGQRIVYIANAEAAQTKELAQSIINEARTEAHRINAKTQQNLAQANETIARVINQMQGLLVEEEAPPMLQIA
jgi:DivIVA domain-containing protein